MTRTSRHAAEIGLAAAVAVLSVCLVVVFKGTAESGSSEPALPGSVARNFKLPDVNRKVLSLDALRGNVVVAVFSGECDPSNPRFTESLTEAMKTFADMPEVSLVAVRAEQDRVPTPEEASRLRTVLNETNWRFPALVDGSADVTRRYSVGSVPTLFVIDGKGVIRFRREIDPAGRSFELCRQTVASLLTQS